MRWCLCIRLSSCLSVCPVRPSIHPSICLSVHASDCPPSVYGRPSHIESRTQIPLGTNLNLFVRVVGYLSLHPLDFVRDLALDFIDLVLDLALDAVDLVRDLAFNFCDFAVYDDELGVHIRFDSRDLSSKELGKGGKKGWDGVDYVCRVEPN